jgi:hypothetical protein
LYSTLYRCLKALQAVGNFIVAMALAVNRHRVSLMMQVVYSWRGLEVIYCWRGL